MPAITIIAWINFIAAGVLALMVFSGNLFLLPPAIAAGISGCLFLAIDKGLSLLTEIRDRLPESHSKDLVQPTRLSEGVPTRSIAEIEADLARMLDKTRT